MTHRSPEEFGVVSSSPNSTTSRFFPATAIPVDTLPLLGRLTVMKDMSTAVLWMLVFQLCAGRSRVIATAKNTISTIQL